MRLTHFDIAVCKCQCQCLVELANCIQYQNNEDRGEYDDSDDRTMMTGMIMLAVMRATADTFI